MWGIIRHYFVVTTIVLSMHSFVDGAKFLLTVPSQPHYDTQYTATITAYEVYEKESVSLEYRGVKDSSRLINRTVLWFEFDGVKTWTVTFPWDLMEKYEENAVTLTLATLYNEEKKTLYFNKDTGYIFIQTDKPLYTPRQTVKFRVIAVDEYQRLAKYPLKIDIRNDKMIIVDRMRYSAEEAFKGQEFELPKETMPGNWTITANYEGVNNVESNSHSVTFEVREYVLPRFSAKIKISKDVITKSTHWITITVTANYVYGLKTMGSVEMQLGIWDPVSGLKLLPQKYISNLTKGVYKEDIRVNQLIPTDLIVRASRRLYVTVNVTEEGTGENDTIVDTSTFIAHPYYDITYTDSKKRFKPGFPYTLHTQVRARSGRPASWLNLWISAEFNDANGKWIKKKTAYHPLDQAGKIMLDFEIPKNAVSIKFKTVVLDFKAGTNNDNEFKVQKLESPNSQYLHIALIKPIKKDSDGLIRLRYTPPPRSIGFMISIQRITVLVLAKGHKVFSDSVVRANDGRSMVKLPKKLYKDVSPSMRVVASFYHTHGTTPEFVIDSLNVDTEDVCLEELSLRRSLGMFERPGPANPKEKYNLQVTGGPGMSVGMVAVDQAVFLLNDAHTLTRESVFQRLASHDQGKGSGDGLTMEEVMKNSGLVHLFVDNDEKATWERNRKRQPWGQTSHLRKVGHKINGNYGPQTGWNDNKFLLNVDERVRAGSEGMVGSSDAPPQSIRQYFPESWLFNEYTLPKSGKMSLNLTLPDSITTWSFMAVGLSARRGVCMSKPLEQKVQKLFFVDVRLPYKATRLEEVKVKIAIYNYHTEAIEIKVKVTGSQGLCFSANRVRGTKQNITSFSLKIGKRRTKSRDIKIIPLENGPLKLQVDAFNVNERDIVERDIYVVAEGLRMRKSLTFVLDPEAKHATFNAKKRAKIMLADTATIKNSIDMRKKTQKTQIDLAMPREIIRGTENCKISAFGDLMGDIINHAVIKSKSLMDQSVQNAEEVLGDLGPTVHALLYANKSGLMDETLSARARKFVIHGVARLSRYRKEQAFSLTPKSPEGTWLTTAVLKTLCWSSHLAFIDKAILIDHGFFWLLNQVTDNGTMEENDWRLAKDSQDYQVMLSAEVLIAIIECDRKEHENHATLLYNMAYYLEENLESIQEPMVLAKVAYALTLFDKFSDVTGEEQEETEGEEYAEEEEYVEEEESYEGETEEEYEPELKVSEVAVKRLAAISKKNAQGQVYWSSEEVTNEDKKVPFWYRKGVKASAIEATAFSLLVFLNHPGANVDSIADWLVSQRNDHGSFIGALDSMAAIQALSSYSLQKTGHKVDLSCNITSDKTRHYSHSFKFTHHNAIKPESLNNVPVGHSLEVLTKGQGLGQMQVNVEYNVPIDPNEKCEFNVTVEVKPTEHNSFPDMHDDELCQTCSWWCRPLVDNTTLNSNMTGNETWVNSTDTAFNFSQIPEELKPLMEEKELVPPPPPRNRPSRPPNSPSVNMKVSSLNPGVSVNGRRTRKPSSRKRSGRRSRKPRSIRSHSSASRKSICVKVCLQHVDTGIAGHTRVEVEMLTGYKPVTSDIETIKKHPDVLDAWFALETDKLVVFFKQVSDMYHTCVGFRAVDQEEVGRPTPASVIVTQVGNPGPSCALEYQSPSSGESLQVYCADFSNKNRGECRCYSGLCSTCSPISHREVMGYSATTELVCHSDIGYQVQVSDVTDRDQWLEIDAKVLSANRTGSHKVGVNDTIKMMSPASCMCPTFFGRRKEKLYMLSTDVEKMVDRYGNIVHHYLLDEQSIFLRVSDPNSPKRNCTSRSTTCRVSPTVDHMFLKQAFKNCPP